MGDGVGGLAPDGGVGVDIELEAVAVGVGEVDGLADPVVREAEIGQPVGFEVRLGRAQLVEAVTDLEGDVVEADGVARRHGGVGADLDNLLHMHSIADKLFGDSYEWSVLAAGRHQMSFATEAAMLGGNLRVGLEDSLYIGPGELAATNASQVRKIRTIVESLGYRIATPTEARERLGLKGADRVAF